MSEVAAAKLEYLQKCVSVTLEALATIPQASPIEMALRQALEVSKLDAGEIARHCAFVAAFNLPPKELSPNRHAERYVRARRAKRYREDCAITFGVSRSGRIGLPLQKCSLVFDWYLGDNPLMRDACFYPADIDNALASLKPAIDALKDAGIIVDDNAQRLTSIHCNLLSHPKENRGRAEIVVKVYKEE